MKLATLAGILMLSLPVFGDEIALKDGRKIQWTSLRDAGDSIDVETAQGTKFTVAKKDIEGVVIGVPQAPLTGAVMMFDKKAKLETTDLLASLDPKKAVAGTWKISGKMAVASAEGEVRGRVQLPHGPLPEEYDLQVEALRKDGSGDFILGLVAGKRQFALHFDGMVSTWTGVAMVDGNPNPTATSSGVFGKFFTNGKPKVFTVMIRKDALVIRAENKDFFVWRPERWERVSLHPLLGVPDPSSLFVGCYASTYQITKLILVTSKG